MPNAGVQFALRDSRGSRKEEYDGEETEKPVYP
jgi:hypothetical protein